MKFLSEKKTTIFYFLAATALLCLLVIFYFNTQKIKSTSQIVEHTQEVLRKSDNVLLDVLNIESGFRGFLLSGDENFLQQFADAASSLDKDLEKLSLIISDNKNQQPRLIALKKATKARLVYTIKNIDNRKHNSLSESEKKGIIEIGGNLTNNIKNIIVTINSEEFSLLKQRKTDNENSNQFSEILFALFLVLITLITVLVIISIINQKIRRKYEDEIKQSSELFSNLFNSNPASISINRLDNGKIINVNQSFLQLFGFISIDEVIGKTFAELNVFVDPNYGEEILHLLKENKMVKDFETNIKTRQGEIKWTSASVLFLEVENLPCLFFVSIDITNRKKAEEKLLSANEELKTFTDSVKLSSQYARSLIEASLDPMFTINPLGKITDINNATVKVTGASRDEIIGKDFFDYFTAPSNARKAYQQVFAEGFISDYPLTIIDGELIDVLCNGSVYKDGDDIVQGVVIVARDITAEKLLSKYSLSLIEASLDPLVTISTEGKITDINEAFVNITGIKREKLKGSDFFDYFTEPQMAREVYQEVFAKGSVADSPLTLRHIDGKLTDVLFNGSVYKDDRGNVLGVVIVARDVTEQRRFEKELIEAKVFAEMATAIAEEAKAIAEKSTARAENAARIAEDAVKAKQQFLSNMSHEIRTPMNAIIGFTKVVLKTNLSEKQKEYLNAIKMSGDSLIVLINDILDLAKVDAGKMKFEQTPFKMAASISAMVHVFETKIQEKNLRLVKEYDSRIPKVLVGDPVRLHQIILNLISNAVKFTKEGQITVNVELLGEDEEKATIQFSVTDTGIGIPRDKIKYIFENFQQASSETSRLYGGTGLGLAIAKQLVESQGGTITVKSKIDNGSTFSFILSFQKTKAEAEPDTELMELNLEIKNIKVLVVEDIALNQLLMKTLLDDFGFEHEIVGNGKIAIERLTEKPFDIILMDLQMPEMNGFEATEYIRNTMNSQIPIIALTADVTTADLQKCTAIGMNDYLAKPIDERLLYKKIIDLLKTRILIKDDGTKIISLQQKPILANRPKCIDLTYMNKLTKAKPELILEMIRLYLEQTPILIGKIKQGLRDKDWDSVHAAIHKMIPSFSLVGLDHDFEIMAINVQENTRSKQHLDELPGMVLQLENICSQACGELQIEVNLINNKN